MGVFIVGRGRVQVCLIFNRCRKDNLNIIHEELTEIFVNIQLAVNIKYGTHL